MLTTIELPRKLYMMTKALNLGLDAASDSSLSFRENPEKTERINSKSENVSAYSPQRTAEIDHDIKYSYPDEIQTYRK